MPFVADLPADWEGWIAGEGLAIGTPFLISPTYEFDVVLNGYFLQASMVGAIGKTREAHARDLAAFLSFLRLARNERCWRDAAEADHLAYLGWRRRDPLGPRVSGATWDREVATVNQFYRWVVRSGHVVANPIRQVRRRPVPVDAGWAGRGSQDEQRPATYSHASLALPCRDLTADPFDPPRGRPAEDQRARSAPPPTSSTVPGRPPSRVSPQLPTRLTQAVIPDVGPGCQYQVFRPPMARPVAPRMVSTAPATIRMMPIVHRIEMPNTKPRISRMIPKMIMVGLPLSVSGTVAFQ